MGQGQQQGAEGYKIGNLKRQLETVPIFYFDKAIGSPAAPITQRLWLTGLQGNLKVLVAVGVVNGAALPYVYPGNPGTMQLYPSTKFGDSDRMFMRPVFQDPTSVANINAPLPQQIPYGWENSFTETDDVLIEVILNAPVWNAQQVGQLVCQVTVEYNGAWWDVDAFTYALSRVKLTGNPPVTVGTNGGG